MQIISYTSMNINIKLLEGAKLPFKATPGSCAYDLYAARDGTIIAGQRASINTGVCISLPQNFYAKIESRSGLARDYGLIALGGVCDSDYRGEYIVMLYNSGNKDFTYKKHDRIAQMIILKHETLVFNEVDTLDQTTRGESGFGGSGN